MIVMQYIDEPFFNDLRTQQQLGYVVQSYHVKLGGVSANRLAVQSPKKSCEYLVGAINKFLIEIKEKFANLSDEEFTTVRDSIQTKIAERDITLKKQAERFWREINNHEYNFDRQSGDLEVLKTITKADMQAHFVRVFFSDTSKRLDICLTTLNHKEEQATLKKENEGHEIWKQLKRVPVTDSISGFKKQCGLHPNVSKAKFMEKKNMA